MTLALHSRKAFSIVEVMVGATVLVVGFIALIQAVTTGSEMIDTARKQEVARQIIDAEIAKLRLRPWGNGGSGTITYLADSTTYTVTVNSTGTSVSGDTAYFELTSNPVLRGLAKDFTVTLVANYLRPGGASATTVTYLSVTYTVSWNSNTGRAYSRSTTAYLGEHGLQLSYQKA